MEKQEKELGETGEEWEEAWDDVKGGVLRSAGCQEGEEGGNRLHDRAGHVGLASDWRGNSTWPWLQNNINNTFSRSARFSHFAQPRAEL